MRYIEILAGIRFWIFAALVALLLICLLTVACCAVAKTVDCKRKIRLLKSHGCERYLSGVPSVGNGAFYGWKTVDYQINIDERDIAKMKYNRLKKILEDKTRRMI